MILLELISSSMVAIKQSFLYYLASNDIHGLLRAVSQAASSSKWKYQAYILNLPPSVLFVLSMIVIRFESDTDE